MSILDAPTKCPTHKRRTFGQWLRLQQFKFREWLHGNTTTPISDNAMYYGCGCARKE